MVDEKNGKSPEQPTQQTQNSAQGQKPAAKKSNKTLFIILGVLGALFACGLIIAGAAVFIIGRSAKTASKALETAAKSAAKSSKFKDKDSTIETGDDVKKPDNWPTDVPIYDGTLKFSSTVKEKSFMVGVLTADDSSKILDFYKEKLGEEGWKETSSGNYGKTTSVSYQKEAEKRSVSVSIRKDVVEKEKNYVTLNVTSY